MATGLWVRLLIWTLLLSHMPPAGAQTLWHPAPSFADAIRALPPEVLSRGVFLAVDPGTPLEHPPPSPGDAAHSSFEKLLREYRLMPIGGITALAPAAMVSLNPEIHANGLVPDTITLEDAVTLLLGSLTPAQLQELGAAGLPSGDLTDEQRRLLLTALPRPLTIASRTRGTAADDAAASSGTSVPDSQLSDDFRLFAHLAADYFFSSPDGEEGDIAVHLPDPTTTASYRIVIPPAWDRAHSFPITVQAPNTLKPADLPYAAAVLAKPLPLRGTRTVGDLVQAAARISGLELYCDPHYAGRSVILFGRVQSPVRTRDLLAALALDLTATWRKVGPAFVLTDDLQGVAARRTLLCDFIEGSDRRLQSRVHEAADHLNQLHWTRSLSFGPEDRGALSPETLIMIVGAGSANMVDMPLRHFDPALQQKLTAALLTIASGEPGPNDEFDRRKVAASLTLDSPVEVRLGLRLFLDLPGIGPVQLNGQGRAGYLTDVLYVHSLSRAGDPAPSDADHPATGAPSAAKHESAAPLPRGILCTTSTPSEARAIVDRMAALGLHILYCNVPAGGWAAPANPTSSRSDSVVVNCLNAAIREGQQKGVQVVAVLDTLSCSDPGTSQSAMLPAGVTEDLTVTGETEAQALRRRLAVGTTDEIGDAPNRRWISPADPAVAPLLERRVKLLASLPGLAGLAFQDSTVLGYRTNQRFNRAYEAPLGYTLALRLAFLRAVHADPIDVEWDTGRYSGRRLPLPNFDPPTGASDPLGENLRLQWNTLLIQTDANLLIRLYHAVRSVNPVLPLYFRERRYDPYFQSWSVGKGVAGLIREAATAPGRRYRPKDEPLIRVIPYGTRPADALSTTYVTDQATDAIQPSDAILLDLTMDPRARPPLADLEEMARTARMSTGTRYEG